MVRQLGESTERSWTGGMCPRLLGADSVAFSCPIERCGTRIRAENYGFEIKLGIRAEMRKD